jgi:hypothetical protein
MREAHTCDQRMALSTMAVPNTSKTAKPVFREIRIDRNSVVPWMLLTRDSRTGSLFNMAFLLLE